MRSLKNVTDLILRSALWLLAVSIFVCPLIAQNHQAPRLSNPEIIESETVRDTSKRSEPRYNKVKDETTFFLSGALTVAEDPGPERHVPGETQPRRIPSRMIKFLVYFKYPGKTKAAPDEVVIAFNAGHYRGFQFNDHRGLIFNLSDGPIKLGSMQLTEKSHARQGFGFLSYWETLEMPIKVGLYKQIIASKSVSIQIGAESASLSGGQLKQLRDTAQKHLPQN